MNRFQESCIHRDMKKSVHGSISCSDMSLCVLSSLRQVLWVCGLWLWGYGCHFEYYFWDLHTLVLWLPVECCYWDQEHSWLISPIIELILTSMPHNVSHTHMTRFTFSTNIFDPLLWPKVWPTHNPKAGLLIFPIPSTVYDNISQSSVVL